jgi:hypothetical protein
MIGLLHVGVVVVVGFHADCKASALQKILGVPSCVTNRARNINGERKFRIEERAAHVFLNPHIKVDVTIHALEDVAANDAIL